MIPILRKVRAWLGPNVVDSDDRRRINLYNPAFLVVAAMLSALRAIGLLGALPESAPMFALAAIAIPGCLAWQWFRCLGWAARHTCPEPAGAGSAR